MAETISGGVYAALLTPRRQDGSIDAAGLRSLLNFLLQEGVTGFALNGATGEFPMTTPAQLDEVLSVAREVTGQNTRILCGIGAVSTHACIALAAIAQQHQVHGLLLPMPFFLRYEQEDLQAFCRVVASGTRLPVLLYNLPQFASGLSAATVETLVREVPNIIGIKDSSGSLDILRHLTDRGLDAVRMVGNDSALAAALQEDVCDGVVSGVACVLPEAILPLWNNGSKPESEEFAAQSSLLSVFVEQLSPFPTPWGLKWIAEARGLLTATFAQPVTEHRRAQAEELMAWFARWSPAVLSKRQHTAGRT